MVRHWEDEMIALHDLAAGIRKKRLPAGLFHPFRDDAKIQLSGDLYQCLEHIFGRLVPADASRSYSDEQKNSTASIFGWDTAA
jgi:hypothetical protein